MLRVLARCDCGRERPVRVAYIKKNRHTKCIRCVAVINGKLQRGKAAHNRLPNSQAGLNDLFSRYVRGSKYRGLEFGFSKEEFAALTKQSCHYCGCAPMGQWKGRKGKPDPYIYNGLDRLDSGLGYVPSNVVACCSTCNYMKQDLSVGDFLAQLRIIAARHP